MQVFLIIQDDLEVKSIPIFVMQVFSLIIQNDLEAKSIPIFSLRVLFPYYTGRSRSQIYPDIFTASFVPLL